MVYVKELHCGNKRRSLVKVGPILKPATVAKTIVICMCYHFLTLKLNIISRNLVLGVY